MLNKHHDAQTHRRAGRALALVAGLLALGSGHALQVGPSDPGENPATVMLYIDVDRDGQRLTSPRLFGPMGQAMTVRWQPEPGGAAAVTWELEVTTTAHERSQLRLQARLSTGTPLQRVASPTLITAEGQAARFEVRSADGLQVLGVSLTARRTSAPPR